MSEPDNGMLDVRDHLIAELKSAMTQDIVENMALVDALAQLTRERDELNEEVARLRSVSGKSRLIGCHLEPSKDQAGPMFWDKGDGDFGFDLVGYEIRPSPKGSDTTTNEGERE